MQQSLASTQVYAGQRCAHHDGKLQLLSTLRGTAKVATYTVLALVTTHCRAILWAGSAASTPLRNRGAVLHKLTAVCHAAGGGCAGGGHSLGGP
jgi:hypothetical protein